MLNDKTRAGQHWLPKKKKIQPEMKIQPNQSEPHGIVVGFHDSTSLCDKYMIYRQGPNEHCSLLIFVYWTFSK